MTANKPVAGIGGFKLWPVDELGRVRPHWKRAGIMQFKGRAAPAGVAQVTSCQASSRAGQSGTSSLLTRC